MVRIACVGLLLVAACGDDKNSIDSTPMRDAVFDAPQEQMIHGCLSTTAMDLTAMANVTITSLAEWSIGHNACITVDAGTVVTWNAAAGSSFDAHPVIGGAQPAADASSVITMAGPGSGTTPFAVTFAAAGTFPYFCDNHKASMNGVVYVK